MEKSMKCPVCGKPLSETEYEKALGLWKAKQEHIKHLEEEKKKLKEQEKLNKEKLEEGRKKLKERELHFKQQTQKQLKEFKHRETGFRKEMQQQLKAQKEQMAQQTQKQLKEFKQREARLRKDTQQKLKAQKDQLVQQMDVQIKKGVEKGILEQKKQLKKQEVEMKKTKNKMAQLENSLKVSAKKYEQANEEIKKLKEQIEKGITPQIEGLLEEDKLLAKLEELFPKDTFEHPGKGGDIIQFVIEQGKEIGKIVYECKKVKTFDRKHVEQAKEARRLRQADFAVLVTNAFPAKKQYYFVEKTVFVISPISLEPITYTLRESLVRIAILKISNEAKEKAVQKVYDYLSSNEYNNKMNDVGGQLMELGKDLKSEIASHKRTWEKRYHIYRDLFNDIGLIDYKLKELVQLKLGGVQKSLPQPQKDFVEIEDLEK